MYFSQRQRHQGVHEVHRDREYRLQNIAVGNKPCLAAFTVPLYRRKQSPDALPWEHLIDVNAADEFLRALAECRSKADTLLTYVKSWSCVTGRPRRHRVVIASKKQEPTGATSKEN